MIFTETKLKGAYVIDLEVREDDRGFFARTFCRREFEARGWLECGTRDEHDAGDHTLFVADVLSVELGPLQGGGGLPPAVPPQPDGQAELAERTAHAVELERAVIAGLAPAQTGIDSLVDEVCEHLRALLRDVLCGHLDVDLRALADELLADAAASPQTAKP